MAREHTLSPHSHVTEPMFAGPSKELGAPLARLLRARVSRTQVQLTRSLAARRLGQAATKQVAAALAELVGCQLSISGRSLPVSPASAMSQLSAYAILRLTELESIAVLELELPATCALVEGLAGRVGGGLVATRLTRVEEAGFGLLCLTGLSALAREPIPAAFHGYLLEVSGSRQRALDVLPTRCSVVELTLSCEGFRGIGRLWLAEAAVDAFLRRLPSAVGAELPPALTRVEVSLEPRLGRSLLPQADLTRLSAGDVVVLDESALVGGQVHGRLRLRAAAFELFGALDTRGLVISRANTCAIPKEETMRDVTKAFPPLPVELEVELARISVSLEELAAFAPGMVLPLSVKPGDAVLLRVGERAIARAELVDVEGEVGARVLQLLA